MNPALLLGILTAPAHMSNPNLAIFEVKAHDGAWWMSARFSKQEATTAMLQEAPDAALSDLALKQWIVDHIRETTRFTADGEPVAIGAGRIRLGHHAQVSLQLTGMPDVPDTFTASVAAFCSNPSQQNLVLLVQEDQQDRAMLGHDNRFTATVLGEPEPPQSNVSGVAGAVFVLLGGAVAWRQTSTQPNRRP